MGLYHDGTTSTHQHHGEIFSKWHSIDPAPIRTGIRQGCPLAPLLFLLTAEILAIALLQTPTVQGLRHPRFLGHEQKFSAFVDDSTVFLQRAD